MNFLQLKVMQGLVDNELLYHLSELERIERSGGNGLSHDERNLQKSIIDRLDKLTKPRSNTNDSSRAAPDIQFAWNATLGWSATLSKDAKKTQIGWHAEPKPLTDVEADDSKVALLSAARCVKSLVDLGPDRLCYDFFLDEVPDESIHGVRRVLGYLLRLADERIEDIEIEEKSSERLRH